MKKELDEQLCKDFPLIFRDRHASMNKTCMCYGFPGDGWYDIIREICEEMMLVKKLTGIQYIADQVKEKFGTMRFYYHSDGRPTKLTTLERIKWDDYMWSYISDKEAESGETCEVCGEKGRRRSGSWILTLCDKCDAERNKK